MEEFYETKHEFYLICHCADCDPHTNGFAAKLRTSYESSHGNDPAVRRVGVVADWKDLCHQTKAQRNR